MANWIPTEEECLKLLRKEGASEAVISHSKTVVEQVKKMIQSQSVDRKIILAGAWLHDIGRSKTHGAKHGVIGARILREHEINDKIVKIVERHVGAGIPKTEAVKIGIPKKDYIPETLEERIVCYADKLAIGSYIGTEEEVIFEFKKKLGSNHPAVDRLRKFLYEMKSFLEGK